MYVHTRHNLKTGQTRARGYDLRPGETLATLIASDLLDLEGLWDTITITHHSDHKATIHARDGITTAYRIPPDMDITIYITR